MDVQSVLETLRRVPDRIILATMGRELDLHSRNACLCGWFVRERIAEMSNRGASECFNPINDEYMGTSERCAGMFGGVEQEWSDIFSGVTREEYMPIIELAFVQRVDEAVNPPRVRKRKTA